MIGHEQLIDKQLEHVKNISYNEITNEILNELYQAVQDIQKGRWQEFGARFGRITFDLMNRDGLEGLSN